MPSLCQNTDFVYALSVIVLGISASHFLEMTMFNS